MAKRKSIDEKIFSFNRVKYIKRYLISVRWLLLWKLIQNVVNITKSAIINLGFDKLYLQVTSYSRVCTHNLFGS